MRQGARAFCSRLCDGELCLFLSSMFLLLLAWQKNLPEPWRERYFEGKEFTWFLCLVMNIFPKIV